MTRLMRHEEMLILTEEEVCIAVGDYLKATRQNRTGWMITKVIAKPGALLAVVLEPEGGKAQK